MEIILIVLASWILSGEGALRFIAGVSVLALAFLLYM